MSAGQIVGFRFTEACIKREYWGSLITKVVMEVQDRITTKSKTYNNNNNNSSSNNSLIENNPNNNNVMNNKLLKELVFHTVIELSQE